VEGNGKSIGLVINCSNTKRYYDAQDIIGMCIEYKELQCPGRGFLVRTDLVKDFIQIIDDFLDRNSDNGKQIIFLLKKNFFQRFINWSSLQRWN